jgi:hypothetical protein
MTKRHALLSLFSQGRISNRAASESCLFPQQMPSRCAAPKQIDQVLPRQTPGAFLAASMFATVLMDDPSALTRGGLGWNHSK